MPRLIWTIYNDLSRRVVTPNGGFSKGIRTPKWPKQSGYWIYKKLARLMVMLGLINHPPLTYHPPNVKWGFDYGKPNDDKPLIVGPLLKFFHCRVYPTMISFASYRYWLVWFLLTISSIPLRSPVFFINGTRKGELMMINHSTWAMKQKGRLVV